MSNLYDEVKIRKKRIKELKAEIKSLNCEVEAITDAINTINYQKKILSTLFTGAEKEIDRMLDDEEAIEYARSYAAQHGDTDGE